MYRINASYRKQNIYLFGGGILFMLIIYFTTLQKTWDLYQKNKLLSAVTQQGEGAFYTLELTEKKFNDLNTYFKAYSLDSLKNQQYIMSEVSDLCRHFNITLKSFPQSVTSTENDFSIETNVIETQGSFTDQLQLLYALETSYKMGRISSITYTSFMDTKNKKTILLLTIYLQNVKNDAYANGL